MNSQKSLPNDREVPRPIRFITRGFVYREFTWAERFKILLGYRGLLEIHFASEHNPGTTQPVTKFHLTAERTQASALLQLRKEVEADARTRGVEPNTMPTEKP